MPEDVPNSEDSSFPWQRGDADRLPLSSGISSCDSDIIDSLSSAVSDANINDPVRERSDQYCEAKCCTPPISCVFGHASGRASTLLRVLVVDKGDVPLMKTANAFHSVCHCLERSC